MINISVFASGEGTNFQAIIDAIKKGDIKARIKSLVTDNSKAGALKRAEKNKIPYHIISLKEFDSYDEYTIALKNTLAEDSIDLIVLAGFMKKIPKYIVERYRERIINIHPALIPAFSGKGYYGFKVFKKVLEYGVKVTGVTVHIVDEKYDHGPIIAQRVIRVDENETLESLAEKTHKVEHKLYPQIVALFAENKIEVEGRKVRILRKNPDSLFDI